MYPDKIEEKENCVFYYINVLMKVNFTNGECVVRGHFLQYMFSLILFYHTVVVLFNHLNTYL